ncbi:hypothetical protein BGZ65_012253 [Modicella reniformis]|uniref:Uncharacterized protein n=1 Tax=Modicella reniformis TaxID=1440133 RepID=A0A9P6LRN0_9FUNG|nr:hypothetical protein BGZ65_012253 [Modicella reniformis]
MTTPISPRPLNATGLGMPTSILVSAAQNRLEVLGPAGVVHFEEDEMEESLDYVLPVSKLMSSPEGLFAGASVSLSSLDHRGGVHKPLLDGVVGDATEGVEALEQRCE